ncbi:AAA family ATPase [Acetobacteraceae bacterium]|nr:AAA family ATPase [Acetobacteraceae bacterium]
MLSPALDKTLRRALIEAEKTLSEYLTLEHLLLALTEDEETAEALQKKEISIDELRSELREFLKTSAVPTSKGELAIPPTPTLAFQRVIQRAIIRMQAENENTVSGMDLLVSLFSEKESFALHTLMRRDFTRLEALEITGRKSNSSQSKTAKMAGRNPFHDHDELGDELDENPLLLYCRNLTEEAKEGRLDPLIGREKELFRTVQILCRRHKNNPLLVGNPGVGKTAIAEGLAKRIVQGKVPEILKNLEIFALNTGAIVAGTRYRGDFEERITALLEALEDNKNALLFIDEAHVLMGAGSSNNSGTDAANLLKPALAGGRLRCIAATTYQEYRHSFERDPALGRRFQKIDIKEPTEAETLEILKGLKPKLECFHKVLYSEDALESAVALSVRHLHQRQLPDKAIDLLDEAGAASRLKRPANRKTPSKIATKEIEDVLAIIANIPVPRLRRDEPERLKDLKNNLHKNIFGQEKAIETLLSAVVLSRSGLRDPEKPIGSYLFSGPTGVGKTALARQLADSMDVPLIRFDMSEYREAHAASSLIGAPPGYVGFETGGALTEKIAQNPHAILLLDEIEKAHPNLFSLLLQIMDYGKLTDRNGKTVDFRNVALIMTTNEGAEELTKESIGFLSKLPDSEEENESLKRLFTPEFRNRLDAVIPFNLMTQEALEKIAKKLLSELKDELLAKEIKLDFASNLASWLTKKSFDIKMGARPLSRLIQKELKLPLAEAMAFRNLVAGQSAKIALKDDGKGKKVLDFSYSPKPSPKKKPPRKAASVKKTVSKKKVSVKKKTTTKK